MKVLFSDEQGEPLDTELIRQTALATMAAEQLPERSEVSVNLVDEAVMASLNETHMGKTGPTDVLSFPLESLRPGELPHVDPDGPPFLLGDIFICPAVVRGNAGREAVPFEDELALMVVHGLLHLLGYDHAVDAEAEHMESKERLVLAGLGRVRP